MIVTVATAMIAGTIAAARPERSSTAPLRAPSNRQIGDAARRNCRTETREPNQLSAANPVIVLVTTVVGRSVTASRRAAAPCIPIAKDSNATKM